MAALVATLGAGQALAGPDERVLERQGRIDQQGPPGRRAGQGGGAHPGRVGTVPAAVLPARAAHGPGPRLDADAVRARPGTDGSGQRQPAGLAITPGIVALLLALGAAATWRIYRRPRPEPTA